MEESTIKVGDKCRLLKDKVLFEKMQTKYSEVLKRFWRFPFEVKELIGK